MLLSCCSLTFTCQALQDWAGGVGQGALMSRWRGRGSLLQGGVSSSCSHASSSPSSTGLRGEGEGGGRAGGGACGRNQSVI